MNNTATYKSARAALHSLVDAICDNYENNETREGYLDFYLDGIKLSNAKETIPFDYILKRHDNEWFINTIDPMSPKSYNGICIM